MNDYDPNYVYVPTYVVLGAKTVVTDEDGKILLLKRSDKVDGAGQWDFGGGAVEEGENPLDAAIRETKEEAGLDVHDVKPFSFHTKNIDGDNVVIIIFTARAQDTNVTLSWEHDEYQWFTWEELQTLQLSELHGSIREAFGKLRDHKLD